MGARKGFDLSLKRGASAAQQWLSLETAYKAGKVKSCYKDSARHGTIINKIWLPGVAARKTLTNFTKSTKRSTPSSASDSTKAAAKKVRTWIMNFPWSLAR